MSDEKRFLVEVGIKDLPFPMKVVSKKQPEGQSTIANISINARIMQEFEANWIDKFIQIVHQHRDKIGTKTLATNIKDYLHGLNASAVKIDFDYPFFIEKLTPVSKEKCLVRYLCTYSAKIITVGSEAEIIFRMQVPVITSFPVPTKEPNGLFGQLSILNIEIGSKKDIYPEDIIEITDKHALSAVYSFLTEEDKMSIIEKIHSIKRTSVVAVDKIKSDLSREKDIDWYSIRCSNFGMLHSYSTIIGTEKSMWVPFSSYESNEI